MAALTLFFADEILTVFICKIAAVPRTDQVGQYFELIPQGMFKITLKVALRNGTAGFLSF